MFETVLHHPRKLWLRKALFQVHLWAGLVLSVYAVAVSLSGSILVFQDEIRRSALQRVPLDGRPAASLETVAERARQRFPGEQLTFVGFPQATNPWWTLYLKDGRGRPNLAYADAASGEPLAQPRRLLIDFILDLHVYLLAAQTGFVVNCVAGAGILLLAVTGALLWWPGIRLWKRALGVSFQHRWKRVNYDLHRAVGIWTLLIVGGWGLTAVYFLVPERVSGLVNAISPVVGMKAPAPLKAALTGSVLPLDVLLAGMPAVTEGEVSGISIPEKPGDPVTVYAERGKAGDFSHRDIVTVDGRTGKALAVWHYGENRSLGDWILWLVYPLHFGTVWGLGVKVVWATLGLSVAVLSVTGVLMYWNRKLSKWVANG